MIEYSRGLFLEKFFLLLLLLCFIAYCFHRCLLSFLAPVPRFFFCRSHLVLTELELELMQTHMAQKPMLRVEVGARASFSYRRLASAKNSSLSPTMRFLTGVGEMVQRLTPPTQANTPHTSAQTEALIETVPSLTPRRRFVCSFAAFVNVRL